MPLVPHSTTWNAKALSVDTPSSRPRPRPGDVAIREEFAAAVVKGETTALQTFIRRHPDHPLAEIVHLILERNLFEPTPAPIQD